MAREITRRRRDTDEERYRDDEVASQAGPLGEDEDEDTPRRGRTTRGGRRTREDDEDTPRRGPARRSRRDDDEDEEPRRPARSRARDDDEDDDRDSRRAQRADSRPSNFGKGRQALRKHVQEHARGDFAPMLKVDKEIILAKPLDDDYFFTFYQHWVREFMGQKRQMAFVCLGDDCPLCAIDHPATFTCLVNLVDLTSDPDNPEVKVWFATPEPGGQLSDIMDKLASKDKSVADPDIYIEISRKKTKARYSYTVALVKQRDMEDDWPEINPLTKKELSDFEAARYDEDACVRVTPRRELLEIADELSE